MHALGGVTFNEEPTVWTLTANSMHHATISDAYDSTAVTGLVCVCVCILACVLVGLDKIET